MWPPTRPTFPGIGVASPSVGSARAAPRPTSTRFEPVPRLRGFNHWFTLVTPLCLASRARTVWQYRPVPSLSGLLAALPCASRVRLPSASPDCCDSPKGRVSHPHPDTWRLVAHAQLVELDGRYACPVQQWEEVPLEEVARMDRTTRRVGEDEVEVRPGFACSESFLGLARTMPAECLRRSGSESDLATRNLKARPPKVGDQTATDPRYCEYVTSVKRHLYSQAWVDRLVDELSTEDGFRRAIGESPGPRD